MKRISITGLAALMLLLPALRAAAAPQAPARPPKVAASKFKSLPGGLKYAVLKPGRGKAAGHGEVRVHYTGWLKSNGKKFDSSLDRGTPFEFPLGHGRVIKGWDQGVKGMKEGEKRLLIVPSSLGYGPGGTPDGTIPPGATLVFEVLLIKVLSAHDH